MHSKYADLSNVVSDIITILTCGVEVEASISLVRDFIGWEQSQITGEIFQERVVVRQCTRAKNGILVGNCVAFDLAETDNDFQLKNEVEIKKFHRMAKVHDFLEMCQGIQNQWATQKDFRTETCKWEL